MSPQCRLPNILWRLWSNHLVWSGKKKSSVDAGPFSGIIWIKNPNRSPPFRQIIVTFNKSQVTGRRWINADENGRGDTVLLLKHKQHAVLLGTPLVSLFFLGMWNLSGSMGMCLRCTGFEAEDFLSDSLVSGQLRRSITSDPRWSEAVGDPQLGLSPPSWLSAADLLLTLLPAADGFLRPLRASSIVEASSDK